MNRPLSKAREVPAPRDRTESASSPVSDVAALDLRTLGSADVATRARMLSQLQRSAGNQAVAAALRSYRVLARADAPEVGLPGVPAATIDPAVDKVWTVELRRQTGNRIDRAFGRFVGVITELRDEFKDEPADTDFATQCLLAALGVLLPGAVGIVVSNLQKPLSQFANELVKAHAGDIPAFKKILEEDMVEELVDAYISLDAADAEQGIRDFVSQAPKPPTSGEPGPSSIRDLLRATEASVSKTLERKDTAVGTMLRGALTGVWAQFAADNTTSDYYEAQLRDLIAKHKAIGGAAGSGTGSVDIEQIVMLDAFGDVNPAIIRYVPSVGIISWKKPHYVFQEWVSPEMREVALAAGERQPGGLPIVTDGMPVGDTGVPLLGHIDNPRSEGARVVELDTTTGPRLAKVDVEGAGGSFVAWVGENEEAFARTQGQAQPGGIVHMDVRNITGVPWNPSFEDLPSVR